ncbi:MAG TPA: arylsulfotransferase family protein [Streptosporangiaceae bacterium]|nr:arylsulfotransferase family protein [Streptosporangiaceae bacterium]
MAEQRSRPRVTGARAVGWRAAGLAVLGAAVAFAGSACTSSASGPGPSRPSGSGSSGVAPSRGAGGAAGATAEAPPLTILTRAPAGGKSEIFISPRGGKFRSGPEIVTKAGKVLWFRPLPAGQAATDFRTQTYLGRPVLTWWQGQNSVHPAFGADYVYDSHYRQIAKVTPGNGCSTDFHEFLITPGNTALITATRTATANLTSIGGPARQKVIDGIVQELDIRTGKVLFEWDSAGHVPYRDSHEPLPKSATMPWDWFHINAAHLDTDGNLLINSRFTWTTYKVDRHTGRIIWELGGRQSTFRLRAGPGQALDKAGKIFAYEHDPEALGHGLYTFFDDESADSGTLLPRSRAVVVRVDLARKIATLVRSYDQPEGLVATAQGSAQTIPGGDVFIGWGMLPYLSEFSPAGRLLFNARFPAGVSSYRAYLLPWPPAG